MAGHSEPTRPGFADAAGRDSMTLPMDGFTEQRIDVGEVQIAAEVGGAGPPLLLLHGYPQHRAMWRDVAPALADRFTVVATDLRGYGQSSKPPGDEGHLGYSKRTMAADQVAVMRQLGFGRFAEIGRASCRERV